MPRLASKRLRLVFIQGARSLQIDERRQMIDRTHGLSVTNQSLPLALNRSTAYYNPVGESQENLAVMREMDVLLWSGLPEA